MKILTKISGTSRLKYILSSLFVLTLIVTPLSESTALAVPSSGSNWPKGPSVNAESAIVMEASTGLILYAKNIDTKQYPASTTKVLTTLVALENSSLNEVVTFSHESIFDVELDSSRIGIEEDEELTMQQCLYGIMLESANEVSYAVAEHIGGSIDNYATLMNETAARLGCKNSHFTNPHGLPDDNHYTTAYDLALITKAAMQNETFRKITSTRTYQIPPTNIKNETRYLRNHHRFILRQDYFYNDCIGGKTGYTNKAKYSLVSIAKRGDMELICVVMKDDTFEHQYTDTQALFNYGFDNFSIYNIANIDQSEGVEESKFFTKYNPLLSGTNSPISIDKKGFIVLPNGVSIADATKTIVYNTESSSNDQQIIGTISYEYNGEYIGGANILYSSLDFPTLTKGSADGEDLEAPPITPSKKRDFRPILIASGVGVIVFLILIYIVFVEIPRIKRRKAYLKKRRNRKYQNFKDLDL